MDSYRITMRDSDVSYTIPQSDSTVYGYTVIKAPKGNTEALYFPKGSANYILQALGLPSADFPHVQEVLDFNAKHGLWVSAPAGGTTLYPSYFGGVYLTAHGLFSYYEVDDKDNPNYEIALPVAHEKNYLSSLTNCAIAAPNVSDNNQIVITGIAPAFYNLLGFTRLDFVFPNNNVGLDSVRKVEVFINKTTNLLYVMNGVTPVSVGTITGSDITTYTFTLTGNVVNIAGIPFQLAEDAPGTDGAYFVANWTSITKNFIVNVENETYIRFHQSSPREVITTLDFSELDYVNSVLTFIATENYLGTKTVNSGTIRGSLVPGAVDGFKADIYLPSVMPSENINIIEAIVIKPFDTDVVTTLTAPQTFYLEGQRLAAQSFATTSTILAEGWDSDSILQKYSDVYIFFDVSGDTTIHSKMVATAAVQNTAFFAAWRKCVAATTSALMTELTAATANSGKFMSITLNEFLRKEPYTATKFWSPAIGVYASNLADIMENKFGGVAPMFTNMGGLGGQLNIDVIKAKYEFTEDQKEILEKKAFNPIINSNAYGVMVTNQRTATGGNELTDWSYVGHTMAFNMFRREIKNQVLIPQLGKHNNGFFQKLRREQAETILRLRTAGQDPIWTAGQIICEPLNIDEVLAAREFRMMARIKVTIFSEFVLFDLVNVGQTTVV